MATVPNWPASRDRRRDGGGDGQGRRRRRDLHLGLLDVPLRRQLRRGSGSAASRPLRHREAGRSGRPGRGRRHRRVEEDARRGRHPHHAARGREARDPTIPGFDRILRAAVRHDFPVNLLCWGRVDAGIGDRSTAIPTRASSSTISASCSRATPPAPAEPWADLPKVLDLAKRPNAVIKVSGACTLSQAAVSVPRHLGSAGARVRRLGLRALPVGHRLDPRLRGRQLRAGGEAVPGDRTTLSDSERAMLMGGACAKAYGWSPKR